MAANPIDEPDATSAGASTSWEANKANQQRIGDSFLTEIAMTHHALSARWGRTFAAFPEEELTKEIFQYLGTYVTSVYKTAHGKFLAIAGAKAVWGGLVY